MDNFFHRAVLLPLLMLVAAPGSAFADGGTVIIPIGLILVVIITIIRIIISMSR